VLSPALDITSYLRRSVKKRTTPTKGERSASPPPRLPRASLIAQQSLKSSVLIAAVMSDVSIYTSEGNSVQMLISPDTNINELSGCIVQALKSSLNVNSVAGLYEQSTGCLIPLSHIVHNASDYAAEEEEEDDDGNVIAHDDIHLGVFPPSYYAKERKDMAAAKAEKEMLKQVKANEAASKGTSMIDMNVVTLAAVATFLFGIAYLTGSINDIIAFFITIPFYVSDILIETPLKQLYRKGPSLIGWEGASLPIICSRITYHGDEAFWTKNIDECAKIFRAKEAALLLVLKPVMYVIVFSALVSVARSLIKAAHIAKPDPDMVATYKAFKVLSKQLTKGDAKDKKK
jgi:hypothetical protein